MNCTFEGCENKITSKGLCSGHYSQRRRGVALKPLRTFTKRDENGKVCTRCGEYHIYEDFYKKTSGVYFAECKGCYSLRQKAQYLARRGQEGA